MRGRTISPSKSSILAWTKFNVLSPCFSGVLEHIPGFLAFANMADGSREWLGIAGTGKKFDTKCFMMMKVLFLLSRKLILLA